MSRPIQNIGIPDTPQGNLERYAFDQWLRNTVLGLQAAMIPPSTPTNFRATALAGAVQIDFTRSDGDSYELIWNTVPSTNGSVHIDLGKANKYVDEIGDGGVKRYYALRAEKGNVNGEFTPWRYATTLALGTSVTPPTPPPATDTPFIDDETNALAIEVANKNTYFPI